MSFALETLRRKREALAAKPVVAKKVAPLVPIREKKERVEKKDIDTTDFFDSLSQVSFSGSSLFTISSELLKNGLSVCECNVENGPSFDTLSEFKILAYDPRPGTVDDPRMGTLKRDVLCSSCHLDLDNCPGHLGYISLVSPIINPLFSKIVVALLNCFCSTCGRRRFDINDMIQLNNLNPTERLVELSKLCRKKKPLTQIEGEEDEEEELNIHKNCRRNLIFTEKMSHDKKSLFEEFYREISIEKDAGDFSYTINRQDEDNPKVYLPVEDMNEIIELLSMIPKDELLQIGHVVERNGQKIVIPDFSDDVNPKSFIVQTVPVIPPCARVYSLVDGKEKPDDLTGYYSSLIRVNNSMKKMKSESSQYVKARTGLFSIYSQIIITIKLLIKGKEGIIRNVVMGKRVDYSGRSVLNPFNSLNFGEVAIPAIMKRIHTKNFKVNAYNQLKLGRLFQSGKICYITFKSEPNSPLFNNRARVDERLMISYVPQIGDILEREGMDGDENLFNRQPTLHKQSIMGYRAKYIEDVQFGNNQSYVARYRCIGIHSSCTTPHNADFDGDEGNVYKIQTIGAQSETRHIADVGSCIMSAQDNSPIIGLVYNALSSAYLMTMNDDRTYSDEFFKEAESNLTDVSHVQRLYAQGLKKNGKLLFSLLLPPKFYYQHAGVEIRNGVLTKGVIRKSHIGPTKNSIVQYIWKSFGKERTERFLTEGQKMMDWFIQKRGFGIGIRHCLPVEGHQVVVEKIIQDNLTKTQTEILGIGKLDPESTQVEKDMYEARIRTTLDTSSRLGRQIGLEALPKDNPLNVMGNSGAKGKESNTAQIVGCLGQQYIMGIRPFQKITTKTRLYPYYEPDSDDIESHGFIKESFMKGTNPGGFMFHMMASRVGLTDTQIKTAENGYAHRKMVKSLEDLCVHYDGSIRNMNGIIFCYSYYDGFNAGELLPVNSQTLGTTVSFVDVNNLAGMLNAEAGF